MAVNFRRIGGLLRPTGYASVYGGLMIALHALVVPLVATYAAVGGASRAGGASGAAPPPDPAATLGLEGAALALAFVVIIAAEAVLIVGLVALYRRLPKLAQRVVRWSILGLIIASVAWSAGPAWRLVTAAVFVAGIAAAKLLMWLRIWWLASNIVALLLGTAAVTGIATILDPTAVLLLLGGMALYDAIAVLGTGHMVSLAEWGARAGLPVMLVVPSRLRAEWPIDMDDDESFADVRDRAGIKSIVGLGDLAIPTLLTATVVLMGVGPTVSAGSLTLPVPALGSLVGAVVGMVILYNLLQESPTGTALPGLPVLSTTTIAGYALVALAAGWPLAQVAGLGVSG